MDNSDSRIEGDIPSTENNPSQIGFNTSETNGINRPLNESMNDFNKTNQDRSVENDDDFTLHLSFSDTIDTVDKDVSEMQAQYNYESNCAEPTLDESSIIASKKDKNESNQEQEIEINVSSSKIDMNLSLMNMDVSSLNISSKKPEEKLTLEEMPSNIRKPEPSNCSFVDKAKQDVSDAVLEEETGHHKLNNSATEKSLNSSVSDKAKQDVDEAILEETTGQRELDKSATEKSLNCSSMDINLSMMNMDVSLLNMSRKKPVEKELLSSDITNLEPSSHCSLSDNGQDVDKAVLDKATDQYESTLDNRDTEKSLNSNCFDNAELDESEAAFEQATGLRESSFDSPAADKCKNSSDTEKAKQDEEALEQATGLLETSLNNPATKSLNCSYSDKAKQDEEALEQATGLNESFLNYPATEKSSNCSFTDTAKQDDEAFERGTGLSESSLENPVTCKAKQDDEAFDRATGLNESSLENPVTDKAKQDDEAFERATRLSESSSENPGIDKAKQNDEAFERTTGLSESTFEKSVNYSSMDMNSSLMGMDVSLLNMSQEKENKSNQAKQLNSSVANILPIIEPSLDKSATEGPLNASLADKEKSVLEQPAEILLDQSVNQQKTELNVSSTKLSTISIEPSLDKSATEGPLNGCFVDKDNSVLEPAAESLLDQSTNLQKTELNVSSTKLNVSVKASLDKSATEGPLNASLADKEKSVLEEAAEVLLDQSTNHSKTELNLSSTKLNVSVKPSLDKSATEGPLNASLADKEKSVLEQAAEVLLDQSTNHPKTELDVSSNKLNVSVKASLDKSATEGPLNASLADKEKSVLEQAADVLLDQSTNHPKTELDVSSNKLNVSVKASLDKSATEGPLNASLADKEKSVLEQAADVLLDQSKNQPKTELDLSSNKLNVSVKASLDKSATEGPLNASLADKEKSVLEQATDVLLDQSTSQPKTELDVSSNKLNVSVKASLDKSATEGLLNASLADKEKSVLEQATDVLLDQSTNQPKTELDVSSNKLNVSVKASLDKSATEGPLNASLADKEKSVLEQAADVLLDQSTNQPKTDLDVSSTKLNVSVKPSLDKSATEGPLNASLADKEKSVLEQAADVLLDQSTNQPKTDLDVSSTKLNVSVKPSLDKSATEGPLNASLADKEKSVLEQAADVLLDQSTNQPKTDLDVSSTKLNVSVKPSLDKSATEGPLNASLADKEKSVLEHAADVLLDQSTNQPKTELDVSSTKLNVSVKASLDKSAIEGPLNTSLADVEKSVLEQAAEVLLDQSTNQPKTELSVSSTKLNTSIEPSLDTSATEGPLNGCLVDKDKSVLEQPADVLLDQSTNQPKTELNVSSNKINVSVKPSLDKSATEGPLNASLADKEKSVLEQPADVLLDQSINQQKIELNVTSTKLNLSVKRSLDKSGTEGPLNASLADKEKSVLEQAAEVLLDQSTNQHKTELNVSSTKLNVSVKPSLDKLATEGPLNASFADKDMSVLEQHAEALLDQSANQQKSELNVSSTKIEELSEKTDTLGPLSKANTSVDNNIKTEKSLNSMDSSTNLGVFPLDINKKLNEEENSELNLSTQFNDSADSSSIEILPLNQMLEGIESIYSGQDKDVLNVHGTEPELRSSTPLELSPRIIRNCSTIDEELESLVQDLSEANESGNNIVNVRCPTPAHMLRERLNRAEQIANRLRHDLLELTEFTTYEAQCMKSEKMALSETSHENEKLKQKLCEAESTIDKNVQLIAEINSKVESLTQTNESLASQNKKLSKECDILKIKLTDEEVRVELSENRWKKIVEELQNSLDEAWRVNTRPKLENIELKTEYQIGFNQNVTANDLSLCMIVSESPEATRRNMSMDENCTVKLDENPNNSLEDPLKSTIVECISDDSDADSNFGTPLASQNGDMDYFKNIEEESVKRCLKYEQLDHYKIQKLLEEITGQKYSIENVASDFEAMLDYITEKIVEGKKLMGYNTHDFFKQMIDSIHNHQSLKSAYDELNQCYNNSQNFIKSLESELLDNDKIKEAIKLYALPEQNFENNSDIIKSIKKTKEEYDKFNKIFKSIQESIKELVNYHIDETDIDSSIKSLINELKDYDKTLKNTKTEINSIKNSVQDLASIYHIDENDVESTIKSIKEKFDATYNSVNSENNSIKKSINQLAIKYEIDETNIDLIIESIVNKINHYEDKFINFGCLQIENSTLKKSFKELASILNIDEDNTDLMIKSINKMSDELITYENLNSELDCLKTENCTLKKSFKEVASILNIDDDNTHLMIKSINKMIDELVTYKNLKSELDCLKTENCTLKKSFKELASILNIDEDNTDLMIKSSIVKMIDEYGNIKSELDCLKTENSTLKKSFKELASILNIDEDNTDLMIKSSIVKMIDEYGNIKSELDCLKTENSILKKSFKELASILNIDEDNTDLMIKSINKMSDELITYENLKSELDCLKTENCKLKKSFKELSSILNIDDDNTDLMIKSINKMIDEFNTYENLKSDLDSLKAENCLIKTSIKDQCNISDDDDVNSMIKIMKEKHDFINSENISIKAELNCLKTKNCTLTKSVQELASNLNVDDGNTDLMIKSIKKMNESQSELDKLKSEYNSMVKSVDQLAKYHNINEKNFDMIITLAINKVEGYDSNFESLKIALDGEKSKNNSIKDSIKELALIYNIDDDNIDSIIESIKKIVDKQDQKLKTILELINVYQKPENALDIISDKIQSLKENIESLSNDDNYYKIQNLEKELLDANDLKRALAQELISLEPDLYKMHDLMRLSLKDLKEKIFSQFMEKEGEIINQLQIKHEDELNSCSDKIKQFEEELKRKTAWTKKLEEDNDKLNNEYQQIKTEVCQLKSEIENKIEIIKKKEENYNEEIRKLNNRHLLDENVNKPEECLKCNTLLQCCEELKLDLEDKTDCCHRHEETIKETNKKIENLIMDLKSKNNEIETSSRTIDLLNQKYTKLIDESKFMENDLKEKENIILELKDRINKMPEIQTSQSDFEELVSTKAKLEENKMLINQLKIKYEDDLEQKNKEIDEILKNLKDAEIKMIDINADLVLKSNIIINLEKKMNEKSMWEKKYNELEIEIKESRRRFENLSKNLNDDLKCKSHKISELDSLLKSANNSYQSSLSDKTNECESLSKKLEETKISYTRLENKIISQREIYIKEKQELSDYAKRLEQENIQFLNKFKFLLDCVSWDDAFAKLKVKISLCEELTKQLEEEKENNIQLDNESEILYTNIKQLEEELSELKLELYNAQNRIEELNKSESLKTENVVLQNYKKKSEEDFDKIKKLVEKNTFEEALQEIVNYINLCKNLQNELDEKINDKKQLDNENEILFKNIQDLQNELDEAKLKIHENDLQHESKSEDIINKLQSIQFQNISLENKILKLEEICIKIKKIGQKDTIDEALLRIECVINESNELHDQKKLYDSVIEKNQGMKLEIAKTRKEVLKYETMNLRNDNKIKGLISDLEHCRAQIEKLEKEILSQQKKFDANTDKLSCELKQVKDKFTQENIKSKKLEEELNKYKHEINVKNENVDTHAKKPLKESQQNEGSEGSNEHGFAEMLKNESIANLKSKLEKNKAVIQNKNALIQSYKTKILELENLIQTYKTKLEYCGTEQVRPPANNFQSDLLIKIQELEQTVKTLKNDKDIIKKLADRRLKKLNDYEDYLKKIEKFPKQECENVSGTSKSNDRN